MRHTVFRHIPAITSLVSAQLCLCLVAYWAVAEDQPQARQDTAEFQPLSDEASLPERFRLPSAKFSCEETWVATVAENLRIGRVKFPSPLVTASPANNTVHCEFFCSDRPGRKPGVVVLHILGGDFDLARLFCRAIAAEGSAALFLKMPYYGERRAPGEQARMVSDDVGETVRGMTQAVLDIRRARAWLASQDDVDPDRIGIMGISLGGITAALAAGIEPRFGKACLILAGGDVGQVAWTAKELEPLRRQWIAGGGTRESLLAALAPVDPVTYGTKLKGRKVLMLNAEHDEVIPRACTESLWEACGRPEIRWWDAGHYSAARHLFTALALASRFFAADDYSTAK